MDIISYTDSEIAKNFALLESHLKQAQSGIDELFCRDCINKHLILLEGLSEEGMNAGGNPKKYKKVYDFANTIKDEDYKSKGISFSGKARQIRKDYFSKECPECEIEPNPSKIGATTNSPKHLNNPSTFNNQLKRKTKNNMVKFAELGTINLGQFVAEGVKYFLEVRPQTPAIENAITIGGGGVLQAIALFTKMPKQLKTGILVACSNLFAYGIVKMVKGVTAPVVAVRAAAPAQGTAGFTGKPNDRVFGGRVTATGIPTQYARAGILAGAQAYSAPEHSDLIRVD